MPRKDFRSHLQEVQTSKLPKNIVRVEPSEDDGAFSICFQPPSSQLLEIQAHVDEVGNYPKSHTFFIYTSSDNVPAAINATIADIGTIDGLKIGEVVRVIAQKLNAVVSPTQTTSPVFDGSDVVMEDVEGDDFGTADADSEGLFEDDGIEEVEDDDDDDDDDDDFGDYDIGLPPSSSAFNSQSNPNKYSDVDVVAHKARVRADLIAAKKAGYRIAHHGDILTPGIACYLMISCRIAKLKIPEDALSAWHLDREEYIMLLFHYPYGYKKIEHLSDSKQALRDVVLHVAVTKKHKVSITQAVQAFSKLESKKNKDDPTQDNPTSTDSLIRSLFIGSALDEVLNNRLVTLIRYRERTGLSWDGTMAYYNDSQGSMVTNGAGLLTNNYYLMEDSPNDKGTASTSPLISADHLRERVPGITDFSFPLIAMQFTLRHLVRCTEFCLVCFSKTTEDFEALKPYVCSNPLCLYQYMSLGFGPSIEFEILTQPYVVDLLVSLCYNSAQTATLNHFPVGMGLVVPDPSLANMVDHLLPEGMGRYPHHAFRQPTTPPIPQKSKTADDGVAVAAKWDETESEIQLPDEYSVKISTLQRLQVGDWICFWLRDTPRDESVKSVMRHCKIIEMWHPTIRLGTIITSPIDNSTPIDRYGNPLPYSTTQTLQSTPPQSKGTSSASSPSKSSVQPVYVVPYNQTFDLLEPQHKRAAVCSMLGTLPSVTDMRDFILSRRDQHATLSKYVDKMVPAALGILRWIIASNRSCIVQTEGLEDQEQKNAEELVYGMPGYMQFRFASGAPDKESRFIKSVNQASERLKLKHSTIFAWHGSPLGNWHSIIREGLNFDQISHGRAYGNGVYHSLLAQTSLGYAALTSGTKCWPSTKLQISQALSLNEVVNAPKEFVSSNPHLVVNQVDWIQTRYLFIKCATMVVSAPPPKPVIALDQDPNMVPTGMSNDRLVIPITAISKSRRPGKAQSKALPIIGGSKKAKVAVESLQDEGDHSELVSEASDAEDIELMRSPAVIPRKPVPKKEDKPLTDFVPGELDRSTLPMLEPPQYATNAATRNLNRELKQMMKEQCETPLHELGWYIDPEHVDNPYQWIVELHSFDPELPLSKDMKKYEFKSIVLEIRFGPNFNFSPPFVRVIRPRFLPFMSGGGGHVTAGGALCMELLTNDGWNPSATLQSVLLQVRMAITSTDPKPARLLEPRVGGGEYSVYEAVEAYKRACMTHGVSRLLLEYGRTRAKADYNSGPYRPTSKPWRA